MKNRIVSICLCFMLAFVFSSNAFAASSKDDLQARVESAKLVMDQIMGASDRSIPLNILQSATCVAVVPSMLKGAFVFGAQYGQGVVTCRTGHGWSGPVFIRLAGGSFGFQIGGQATDLILVAVNDRGMQDLLKNKFKIGGDASAAAGPVGRAGQASTDWRMNAELLSYSRNKGVFAGIEPRWNQRQPEQGRYRGLLRRPAKLRVCAARQRCGPIGLRALRSDRCPLLRRSKGQELSTQHISTDRAASHRGRLFFALTKVSAGSGYRWQLAAGS